MRRKLTTFEGERRKFKGTFSRLGKKINYHGHSEDTILLTKITDAETNVMVTDHAWFSYTKGFEKVNLTEGVTVEFEARVKPYKKGYINKQTGINNRETDFKLSHPTKIKCAE